MFDRRVFRLARALGCDKFAALGLRVALEAALPKGELKGWTPQDVADVIQYEGDAVALVRALRESELLGPLGGAPLLGLERGRGQEEERAAGANRLAGEFDAWWALYPRKIAKQKAREAYARAVRVLRGRGELRPHDVLLEALERFRAVVPAGDDEFVPYPATWLNGGRWEDDPEQSAAARRRRALEAERPAGRLSILDRLEAEAKGGDS